MCTLSYELLFSGKCDVSCLTFRKIFMQDEGSTSAEGIKETGVAMIPTLSIILGTNRTVHASTSILHILGIAWTFGTLPPIVFAWHIQQLPGNRLAPNTPESQVC